MNLSIKQIQCFLAVSKLESFKLAAAQQNLTPAAISQTIKGLEEQVGFALFNRTTRAVELTPAGWQLLPEAQRIQNAVQDAEQAIRNVATGQRGRLRLAVAPSVATAWLPTVLPALVSESVEIEVTEGTAGQVFEAVASGNVDLGIQGDISGYSDLLRVPALLDPYVQVGEGAQRIGLTLDTSIEQQLVGASLPAPIWRVANPQLALALLDRIDAHAILPKLTVGDRLSKPWTGVVRQLNWIGRPGFLLDPVVQKLVRQLISAFPELSSPL